MRKVLNGPKRGSSAAMSSANGAFSSASMRALFDCQKARPLSAASAMKKPNLSGVICAVMPEARSEARKTAALAVFLDGDRPAERRQPQFAAPDR